MDKNESIKKRWVNKREIVKSAIFEPEHWFSLCVANSLVSMSNLVILKGSVCFSFS